jgi:hypothetical protein
VLFGWEVHELEAALASGLHDVEGGATFANAKALLARRFSVRADVASGPLEQMCRLNGVAGQVILGVDPSLLYAGASPGRHAILLASCIAERLPAWAEGLLGHVRSGTPDPVSFVDPLRPVPTKQEASFSELATAFDRAGREALLVEDGSASPPRESVTQGTPRAIPSRPPSRPACRRQLRREHVAPRGEPAAHVDRIGRIRGRERDDAWR